jgi:hypothetical protein
MRRFEREPEPATFWTLKMWLIYIGCVLLLVAIVETQA